MPDIRTANVSGVFRTGAGTLELQAPEGYLRTVLPNIPALKREYSVRLANGTIITRNIESQDQTYVPYAAPGEKITFQNKLLGETQADSQNPNWKAFNLMLSIVATDHSQTDIADYTTTPVTIALATGEIILTTDKTKVREEYRDFVMPRAMTEPTRTSNTDNLTISKDVGYMAESTELSFRKKVFVYIPTNQELIRIDDNLYVFMNWSAAPLSDTTRFTLENFSAQNIGLNRVTLVTTYGTQIIGSTYFTPDASLINLASSGTWVTAPTLVPFATNNLSLHTTTIYKGVIKNNMLQWELSTAAATGTVISVIVQNPDGTIVSSSGGSYLYQPGQQFKLSISVNGPNPVQIRRVDVKGDYVGVVVTPPPPPVIGTGPVISVGEISKGWTINHEFRAAIPTGTQRIMRHPTMAPGTTVVNQNQSNCTWESPLFLRVPTGSTTLYWSKTDAVPVTGVTPDYNLRTAMTWGQFEVRGKNHNVPSELEETSGVRDKFTGIPVYTPTVKVMIGGADVTKDLVSAGGMSVSLFGEKNQSTSEAPGDNSASTGTPVEEGAEYLVYLDGNIIEWGKVVSYRSTNVHNGTQVEIGAVDPLDYHNLDLDTLDSATIPNAYMDLPGFALSIAARAGLRLDLNGISLPSNQTNEVSDVYDIYGSTVTQELELVANAGARTAVTVPANQSIKFVPFEGGAGLVRPSQEQLCPFITTGYNLAEGYAIVEVTGVSNTIRTTTKSVPLTFVNGGSTAERQIGIMQDMGGNVFNQDQSRWYPSSPVNGLDYIQFETINSSRGVDVMPMPIRFNLRDKTREQINSILAGYVDGWYDYKSEGMPQLVSEDMLKDWWIVAHINPTGWARNPNLKIGEKGRGYFEISQLKFKVESPATIRARMKLSPDELPDSLGPCAVGFKAYMQDLGGAGNMIEFRLGFTGYGIDESKIGILPFICPPSNAPSPHKLPNKKVTVQNPFIVQERPKEGDSGQEFDPLTSPAYARGVVAANGLTYWEALKRHQGEVKFLGGVSGGVGDIVAGLKIIENPTVSIAPGDACWTVFKTSSYVPVQP